MPEETDALGVLARIDALIGPDVRPGTELPAGLQPLGALARRAARGAPPPPGEILVPPVQHDSEWTPRPAEPTDAGRGAPNMGPPAVRIDHWDAYVCRFDEPEGPDRFRL